MKYFAKIKRRAPRILWALLAAPFLCPVVPNARADKAAELKARTEADAKVQAATDLIGKINAYYLRSRLPQEMEEPEDKDWKKAEADALEASRLIDEYVEGGKHVVNGKAAVYFQQGYTANKLGKYQEAIAAYDKAEKAGYAKAYANGKWKGSELWDNRGSVKKALYDYDGAIVDYKAAIALFDDAKWHKHLALALYQKGDILLAVAERARALEMDATIGELTFDAAQAPFNKAIFDEPGKAAPLIERARYTFKKVREEKEGDKNKYQKEVLSFLYGDANSLKADALEPALDDLDRAVSVEPNSAAPLIERGRMRLVYVNLQDKLTDLAFDYADTQKDFEKAIALDPKNAEAWFESGMARLVLWKKEANGVLNLITPAAEKIAAHDKAQRLAIADFSRAIYFKPDAGEAHFQRASLEKQLKNPDYNALFIDYSAAIEQNMAPLDTDWHVLLRGDAKPNPSALADAHLMRGRIFMTRGAFSSALADFDAVIALDEGNLDARFDRGKLRVQRGDYDGAIEDLNRILKINDKVGELWLWRGAAYDGKSETEKAKADLKEAIARDPKIADRLKGSRYDTQNPVENVALAPTPQKEDVKRVPPGTALDHKNAGNVLRGKNDMGGALAEYNMALMIDPNFADALNNRAGVYKDRGELDLALADFNRAIASDPKHRVAYLNRAGVWWDLGETAKQMADYESAIQFAENDARRATVYSTRAWARYKANQVAEAVADAEKATQLAPNDGEAWGVLGRIHLNSGHSDAAIPALRRSIAESAGNLESHVNLSLALGIGGEPAATEEFEQVIHLAEPEELPSIADAVRRAFTLYPNSAPLKAMNERAKKALEDENEVELDGDPDNLYFI